MFQYQISDDGKGFDVVNKVNYIVCHTRHREYAELLCLLLNDNLRSGEIIRDLANNYDD